MPFRSNIIYHHLRNITFAFKCVWSDGGIDWNWISKTNCIEPNCSEWIALIFFLCHLLCFHWKSQNGKFILFGKILVGVHAFYLSNWLLILVKTLALIVPTMEATWIISVNRTQSVVVWKTFAWTIFSLRTRM